jgi:hypothetical protein
VVTGSWKGALMAEPTSLRKKATKGTIPPCHVAAPTVMSSPPAHDSGVVWCDRRQAWAVVSTIERRESTPAIRYLQWCSLVGLEVQCAESCRCLDGLVRTDLPPDRR